MILLTLMETGVVIPFRDSTLAAAISGLKKCLSLPWSLISHKLVGLLYGILIKEEKTFLVCTPKSVQIVWWTKSQYFLQPSDSEVGETCSNLCNLNPKKSCKNCFRVTCFTSVALQTVQFCLSALSSKHCCHE